MKLIGKSGQIQTILEYKIKRLRAGEKLPVRERRWLLTGPPGVGKSRLAKQSALQLVGDFTEYTTDEAIESAIHHTMDAVEYRNGTNVSVEIARDWYRNAPYRPLLGGLSVKVIDEVDAINSAAALNDLRTYLDELAPHRIVIVCTNQPVDKLQPQLQSRFQVFYFEPVPMNDIAAHLIRQFQVPEAVAFDIARTARGDVRGAEADAQTHLDCVNALRQAA